MPEETIFPDGMSFKKPEELKFKVPEFIKGKISIRVDQFTAFMQKHRKGDWVNLDLLESHKGNWYLKLDTWVPTKKQEEGEAPEGEIPGDEAF